MASTIVPPEIFPDEIKESINENDLMIEHQKLLAKLDISNKTTGLMNTLNKANSEMWDLQTEMIRLPQKLEVASEALSTLEVEINTAENSFQSLKSELRRLCHR